MIKINDITLPEPASIRVGYKNIQKTTTTASGRTIVDHIATKKTISVVWRHLTDTEAQQIINTINGAGPYFTLTYTDIGGDTSIDAIVDRPPQYTPLSFYGTEPIWDSLQITFRER